MNLRNVLAGAASLNLASMYLPPPADTTSTPSSHSQPEARDHGLGQLLVMALSALALVLSAALGLAIDPLHGLLGGALFLAVHTVPSALLWLVDDDDIPIAIG